MIKPGEIQNKARAAGVRDQQIEKDYMLSWILQGVSEHSTLSKAIVFKGGTVLKKVYFEDYRFSEDLDFTLLDTAVSDEQIFEWFAEVFEYIKEEANIPLEIIDNNEHQDGDINFYISYVGPLGGLGANKKVKVDISRSEELVFEPVLNKVFISYSDQEEHQLLCYSLEEVLVEKLRCVMQRMQARDFYDIWFFFKCSIRILIFTLQNLGKNVKTKKLTQRNFILNSNKGYLNTKDVGKNLWQTKFKIYQTLKPFYVK